MALLDSVVTCSSSVDMALLDSVVTCSSSVDMALLDSVITCSSSVDMTLLDSVITWVNLFFRPLKKSWVVNRHSIHTALLDSVITCSSSVNMTLLDCHHLFIQCRHDPPWLCHHLFIQCRHCPSGAFPSTYPGNLPPLCGLTFTYRHPHCDGNQSPRWSHSLRALTLTLRVSVFKCLSVCVCVNAYVLGVGICLHESICVCVCYTAVSIPILSILHSTHLDSVNVKPYPPQFCQCRAGPTSILLISRCSCRWKSRKSLCVSFFLPSLLKK